MALNWVPWLFVPCKLFIIDPNLPLSICLFVTYCRTTWMIQSAAWYLSAPPPTRQSLCSFSLHKLSRETSLKWRLKRMKKWWVNTVDDNQVLIILNWSVLLYYKAQIELYATCVFCQVTEIRLKYFDTIPVASAMCVLKTGFLFMSSEFGNQ